MSQFQDTLNLMKQYRMPSFGEFQKSAKEWWQSDSKWFGVSVGGHGLLLLLVAFVPMAKTEVNKQEAPNFESAQVETAQAEADFTNFELGEAPLEPTELSTESLTVMEAPAVEAQTEQYNDDSPTFEARGGSGSNADVAGVGDLGGVTINAIGNGPIAAGTGGGQNAGNANGVAGLFGGGGGGGFGGRGKGSREAMLASGGGTKNTEKAVQAALIWFARHQNPDGSWSLNKHYCRDGTCSCGGEGDVGSDAAATAFALLPFLAAGQTHESDGPFKTTIAKGLNWLMTHQAQTGDLSAKGAQIMYTHGLASIVMCEAYGLSRDKRVGASAQAAVNFIQGAQSKVSGSWVYTPSPTAENGDTSVFGWQLMALKSAQMAGLTVSPQSLEGAKKWLKTCSKGKSGGLFCYNAGGGPSPTMTSVGVLGTQYLGAQRNDPRIIEGMNYFMGLLPNPRQRNCYYWYYATQVMHNLPGPEWDRWNREMRRVLVESQTKEGCAMGSWDPNLPTPDPWGKHGGRIMITSIGALTLEVYYRYLPLYKLDPEDAANKTAMAP